MLKILQNNKLADGMMIVGFGLLAVGIAISFQNQEKKEAEIKITTEQTTAYAKATVDMHQSNPTVKIETTIGQKSAYVKNMDGKVNINNASESELETLVGIGPAMAGKIIEYRTNNGGFKNIEEIKLVKGIGDIKYEKIKDNIEI